MLAADTRVTRLHTVPMGHGDRRGPGKPAELGNAARWVRKALGLEPPQAIEKIIEAGYTITEGGLSRLERRRAITAYWLPRLAQAYKVKKELFLADSPESVKSLIDSAENGPPVPQTGEVPTVRETIRPVIQRLMRKFGKDVVLDVATDEATEPEPKPRPLKDRAG